MHNRLKPLVSLPFIVCLVLLIVNDFYLKVAFHNVVTGKLSDICGLFIFPVFWSVLFSRHKLWVFIISGALFIYWKSEYAEGLIHFVSTYFFSVQRTIDLTDLIALPVLGLAWLSLKDDTQRVNANRLLTNVNPYVAGILTIFSFCATSQPRYVQTFEQPQYVLFRSDALSDSSLMDEGFECYQFDSLLVIKVNQLYLNDRPAKDDDYQKNLTIKDLDKNILGIIPGIKGLMIPGKTITLTIKTPQGDDIATFKGGRLDGPFIRKKNGKVVIEGAYKMGLEDAVWTFRDTVDHNKMTKITFLKGERTNVQHFFGGNLKSSSKVYTRADVKRNKVIQIVAIMLLMVGAIIILVRNYRHKPTEKPQLSPGWKWVVSLIMPLVVWLLQFVITRLLGDDHFDLLFMPISIFLIYMITCPLFLIIVFALKLSRKTDILWYCLFIALAFCTWNEYAILAALAV
jgi:hypothetical protein